VDEEEKERKNETKKDDGIASTSLASEGICLFVDMWEALGPRMI